MSADSLVTPDTTYWTQNGSTYNNFDRLLENAYSFEIIHFAHVVVLLLPDKQITLTGEDGRGFVDYLWSKSIISDGTFERLKSDDDQATRETVPSTRITQVPDISRLSLFMLDKYPELVGAHGETTKEGKSVVDIVMDMLARDPMSIELSALEAARTLEIAAAIFQTTVRNSAQIGMRPREESFSEAYSWLRQYSDQIRQDALRGVFNQPPPPAPDPQNNAFFRAWREK